MPEVRFWHGKEGRTARGVLLREWHYARTVQVLVPQHARRPLPETAGLVGRRVRSVVRHLRDGDLPGAAGIALALLELPRGLVLAAARRRRPWDGARLAAWLDRNRLEVSRCCAAPSRSR